MNSYKCENVITINMTAGDVVEVEFPTVARADIVNYTDGVIFVSEENDFTLDETGKVGKYLTITDGNTYNEYIFYRKDKNKLYVKADADGYVCISRKIW